MTLAICGLQSNTTHFLFDGLVILQVLFDYSSATADRSSRAPPFPVLGASVSEHRETVQVPLLVLTAIAMLIQAKRNRRNRNQNDGR